jgi:hypothetical protein
MSRLRLEMNFNDMLFVLSEGVPGAITVIMDAFRHGDDIDPEGMGAWGFVLNLDMMEIYGSRIWMLYKDVCRENLSHAIAMVRSVQMGVINAEDLNAAIDGRGRLDVDRTVERLKEKLPNFQLSSTP